MVDLFTLFDFNTKKTYFDINLLKAFKKSEIYPNIYLFIYFFFNQITYLDKHSTNNKITQLAFYQLRSIFHAQYPIGNTV